MSIYFWNVFDSLLSHCIHIQAVRKFIQRKCKCHGPTATCSTRTCWDELKDFRHTGIYLKSLYNAAIQVTVRQDGSIIKALSEEHEPEIPSREQLVFLEPSPNYCEYNPQSGGRIFLV